MCSARLSSAEHVKHAQTGLLYVFRLRRTQKTYPNRYVFCVRRLFNPPTPPNTKERARLGAFFRVRCLSPRGLCPTAPFEHENAPTRARFRVRGLSHPTYPLEHVEHARLGVFYVFSAPPPIHSRPTPSHPTSPPEHVEHARLGVFDVFGASPTHPLTPQPHPTCRTRKQAHLGLFSCSVPLPPYVPPRTRQTCPDVFGASPTHPLTPNMSNTSVWACSTGVPSAIPLLQDT